MTDKAEANCGNCGPKQAACRGVQDFGREHRGKERPKADNNRTHRDSQDGESREDAL
jgi:hypothetical protein